MDVFKTHVGEGKALMINEENFYLATRERFPSPSPIWAAYRT